MPRINRLGRTLSPAWLTGGGSPPEEKQAYLVLLQGALKSAGTELALALEADPEGGSLLEKDYQRSRGFFSWVLEEEVLDGLLQEVMAGHWRPGVLPEKIFFSFFQGAEPYYNGAMLDMGHEPTLTYCLYLALEAAVERLQEKLPPGRTAWGRRLLALAEEARTTYQDYLCWKLPLAYLLPLAEYGDYKDFLEDKKASRVLGTYLEKKKLSPGTVAPGKRSVKPCKEGKQ